MKLCSNCSHHQPDNFIICPKCGAPLSSESMAGSPHMQLFMYDPQTGRKIGTGTSMNRILYLLVALVFAFVIIIPIEVVVTKGNTTVVFITFFIWLAIIVASIITAFVCASKMGVSRTAYIYYNGILYREMLYDGNKAWIGGGLSIARKIARIIYNYILLKKLEKKAQDANIYLQIFARYSNGEQVWNSVTGGDAKIDALRNFRIIGETDRQYNYTYIDEKGEMKSNKLLKCYPYIETIFGFCQ